ncbi:MAG TPA: maleylacetoacetate isomerase [Phenylobacterium sp.]|jgi:maleylacetoacetate isomerase|uniref:maleylacetoacetate isomerase n=1 Tax=Phenylobacterium sp. TaxID=1871053 RepID=UPI002C9B8B25|nr:maleylacetoacetate isomerase [Phenylobacterium sp.]HXA38288.1 maleylacetoacetate isomerase [Phenylobacterium sp.]
MSFTLYSAWRATAPYRVRIGLALKGVAYDYSALDLIKGEQREPQYAAVNRQKLTPALDLGGGRVLTQSLSILEWLEEEYPDPPLLPTTSLDRQIVRAMALIVACDIHPLNNTRVGRKLHQMGIDQAGILEWTQAWIRDGFDALEPMVAEYGGGYAFGDTPSLADCCLIPQVYSANRYQLDLGPWPAIRAVNERAQSHPAFQAAHPNQQPDAVPL